MTTPRSSTPGHEPKGRPMPPPAGVNAAPDETGADDVSGYGGGSLVGSNVSGLDAARESAAGTTHGLGEHERRDRAQDRDRDVPIGSALRMAHGVDGAAGTRDSTADATGDLASGPETLGATGGGERAVTGRADANRNSRDDHSLGSQSGVI